MKRYIFALIASASVMSFSGAKPADAQVSVGIQIGPPPAPRSYRVPPRPGPDYEWVDGYWYADRGRWVWHDGYWTRAPYPGAYWVAPYYDRGQYYPGRWEGERGYVNHDHKWDRDARRDEGREHRDDRDHGHDRDHDHDRDHEGDRR